jgi:hypothetical protein
VTSLGTGGAGPGDIIHCGNDACWRSGTDLERMDPVAGGPTVIATVSGGIGDLAFDGTNFYATTVGASVLWSPPPGLVRIPAAGGSPVVLVNGSVTSVTVDDQCVYWSGPSGIFSVAKTAQGPFNQ